MQEEREERSESFVMIYSDQFFGVEAIDSDVHSRSWSRMTSGETAKRRWRDVPFFEEVVYPASP